MKKVLLVLGSDDGSGLPSLDCLLAASVVLHSEPTGDSRFLVLNSHEKIEEAIALMLDEAPHQLKIIYIECSPQTSDEVDLIQRSGLSVYIYDHHITPFAARLASAANINYTQSATQTITSLVSNLYPGTFAHNRMWPRIALLNVFIALHRFIDPLDCETNKESGFARLTHDIDEKYHCIAKTRSDWLGALVYISDHVTEQLGSLDWSFALDNYQSDLFDRAGQFVGRILAVHSFMEALVAGEDTALVSEPQLERFHEHARRRRAAVTSGHLVSIGVSGGLFIGAVVVREGSFKMAPDVASLLQSRAKAQCLIDVVEREGTRMRMRVQRCRTNVDCREVALAMASSMSPEAVVWGRPHEAELLCSDEDFAKLALRLKMDRERVTWRPPHDAPQPTPKCSSPVSMQRRVSTRRLPSPPNAALPPIPASARGRTRLGQTAATDSLGD